ncbi:MAG: RNA polymerase sigma factor [Nevskia sp.]
MASEAIPGDGPPDAALVARCLAGGDRHAFNVLVRRHQGAVRALLRRLTRGDEAWADDLAQETFLLAYRKLDQFRGDARFGTWIYRIAYNVFLMALRARKPEESLDDVPETADAEGDADLQPEETAADLQMDLARAMQRLSPAERAVIAQCYYLDRSHEEAAYALDCPLGTVKSHVSRAKQKLKAALQVWEPRNAE